MMGDFATRDSRVPSWPISVSFSARNLVASKLDSKEPFSGKLKRSHNIRRPRIRPILGTSPLVPHSVILFPLFRVTVFLRTPVNNSHWRSNFEIPYISLIRRQRLPCFCNNGRFCSKGFSRPIMAHFRQFLSTESNNKQVRFKKTYQSESETLTEYTALSFSSYPWNYW